MGVSELYGADDMQAGLALEDVAVDEIVLVRPAAEALLELLGGLRVDGGLARRGGAAGGSGVGW